MVKARNIGPAGEPAGPRRTGKPPVKSGTFRGHTYTPMKQEGGGTAVPLTNLSASKWNFKKHSLKLIEEPGTKADKKAEKVAYGKFLEMPEGHPYKPM